MRLDELINVDLFNRSSVDFVGARPFPHMVVKDFFRDDVADGLSAEFPEFDSDVWHEYNNLLECKRTCNNWNVFPGLTYTVFEMLNSPEFVRLLSSAIDVKPLYSDPGLHGGGWHIHGKGGKLNVHLDYAKHPRVNRLRKINLIVYLTKNWNEKWGGCLGFWNREALKRAPGQLETRIPAVFNSAVLFDTSLDSWHGLPEPIDCPQNVYRKSMAVYYLTDPTAESEDRYKALYAPTKDQEGNEEVLELIRLRSDVATAHNVYR